MNDLKKWRRGNNTRSNYDLSEISAGLDAAQNENKNLFGGIALGCELLVCLWSRPHDRRAVAIDKSLAVSDIKLSADQGNAQAQCAYAAAGLTAYIVRYFSPGTMTVNFHF
jgi:hypothetical protein